MLLKLGSKGEDVKKIQQKLGVEAIGTFGPKTDAAVKQWQRDNGLKDDGIVGDGTWSKMFPAPVKSEVVSEVKIPTSNTSMNITKLKGHVPDAVISQIPDVIEKFKINTPLRLAHFLAQCGHESGGFRTVFENLNYSASGLKNIFPKYFPGNLSESYARNPEKIASKVYGSRMGNGNEATKDGYKFRGRGAVQLTGKDNYKAFGKAIGVDLLANPDLVATKYSLVSAAWFFKTNCVKKCDAGATKAVIESVSKCVNGGLIGISHRIEEFNKFYKLLS
jgi:putative chitinase